MPGKYPWHIAIFMLKRLCFFLIAALLLFMAVNSFMTRGELYCTYQPLADSYYCGLKEKGLIGGRSKSYSGHHAAIVRETYRANGRYRTRDVLALVDEENNITSKFPDNYIALNNNATVNDILLNRYFYNKHDFLLRVKKSLKTAMIFAVFAFWFLLAMLEDMGVWGKKPAAITPQNLNKPRF